MTDSKNLLTRSLSDDDLPDPLLSLQLLKLAQNGDKAALEELVIRYQERIRRIVRIKLGSSVVRRDYDSMDIVNGTFRAALPKIADLRLETASGLLHWLSIIATHQIRDAYSSMRAAKRDVARTTPLQVGSVNVAEQVVDRSSEKTPDEHALLREVRELLDDAVTRLPEDQRRVFLLREYCGEKWERIAAELERGEGAARQLHQRAWIRLRKELRPMLQEKSKAPKRDDVSPPRSAGSDIDRARSDD